VSTRVSRLTISIGRSSTPRVSEQLFRSSQNLASPAKIKECLQCRSSLELGDSLKLGEFMRNWRNYRNWNQEIQIYPNQRDFNLKPEKKMLPIGNRVQVEMASERFFFFKTKYHKDLSQFLKKSRVMKETNKRTCKDYIFFNM